MTQVPLQAVQLILETLLVEAVPMMVALLVEVVPLAVVLLVEVVLPVVVLLVEVVPLEGLKNK
jgi:hypothetical protein